MKHLYFIRHGLSELNKERRWSGGRSNTPLTLEGRTQAKRAGLAAKTYNIDYIISSPLSRAYDTAKIVAQEIGYPVDKIERNSLLIERDFGSLEGQPWQPDFDLDGVSDVETVDSILERATLMLEHLYGLDAEIILVSGHGTFGRAFRHIIYPDIPFGVGRSGFGSPETRFPNGEIVKLI